MNKQIHVQLMSRRGFTRPNELWEFMNFFEEYLPHLKPSVFNWTDPINKPWNLDDISRYIPPDRKGNADSVFWRRNQRPKADGYFTVDGVADGSASRQRHGGVSFLVEGEDIDVATLTSYIKAAAKRFDGEIAQVHWVAPEEKATRSSEASFDMAGANGGSEFVTSSLRYWLPALPWAVVFGDAYVRLFGLERLLSAPAYLVEQLSETAVYLQLSRSLWDLETNYGAVNEVRRRVQVHLGSDAFMDAERAYQLRGPGDDVPIEQFLKAIAEFRPPPPGTNGFRVPDFKLIDDGL